LIESGIPFYFVENQLEFDGRCWCSLDVTPSIYEDAVYSHDRCYWNEAKITFRDIGKVVMKV